MFGSKRMPLRRSFLAVSLLLATTAPCLSRNQWDIEHHNPPAPVSGFGGQGAAAPSDFWAGQHQSMIGMVNPGVVLTGVLENTVTSTKSRAGDTFAFLLPDGFVKGNTQVIPAGSRVVGVVTKATPAKTQRSGHAGSLQVSLQSLVFPDGNHVPFYGFIDANPAHNLDKPPAKRYHGADLRDYGSKVSGMFGSFTNGMGTTMARRYRGNEFVMEKGEMVPIRLNRTVTVPQDQIAPVGQPPRSAAVAPVAAPPPQALIPQQAPPALALPQTAPGLTDRSGDPFNDSAANQPFSPVNSMPDPF